MFLKRTDALASKKRLGTEALAQELGFSRASFWGYRTGGRPISAKAWSKLENAERAFDLETSEALNASDVAPRPDAQRDATLSAAREFNEVLAPAQRKLVRECLRQLDYYLSGVAENDASNGMPARLLRLSHERLDQFAADAQALRERVPQEDTPNPDS